MEGILLAQDEYPNPEIKKKTVIAILACFGVLILKSVVVIVKFHVKDEAIHEAGI
jgi:hypothetical protein